MKLLLSILLFICTCAHAQNSYIIEFTDKKGSQFTVNEPQTFLSARAIERRVKHKIDITESDLPVNQNYINSVLATGVKYINASKWLNQIAIETPDLEALNEIRRLPFVKYSHQVKRFSNHDSNQKKFSVLDYDKEYYGNSFSQINIHEGEYLHQKGFLGNGLMIAVIDAGFYHYRTLPAFDSVNRNGSVYDTYDFVKNTPDVNEENAHGMQCFSIMAANIPGKFVGSSPLATYLLYRSEEAATESPLEEQNWIAALERADSSGADIVTTSLGYNTFDNPAFNYSYPDLNGKTSMMARAATMAARKGMLLLVAAGNEGAKPWKMITTPADADSILAVGAVDSQGKAGAFSSFGPTADGRLSPTVASVGVAATISWTNGQIVTGNGTSFATPNLAGLTACLWQAFPEFSNMEIITAIQNSSNNRQNPNNQTGYGIPNFRLAFEDLTKQRKQRQILEILQDNNILVYPNPVKDRIIINLIPKSEKGVFQLYNSNGQLILDKQVRLKANSSQEIIINDLAELSAGIYFLKYTSGKENKTFKLLLTK